MVEKTKTHDFKGEVYAKLPDSVVKKLGIIAGDEVNFEITDGRILISAGSKEMPENELALLRKIGVVRYMERTPEFFKKSFTAEEQVLMVSMVKNRILFQYEKEGKKLIGIDREYFPYVTSEKPAEKMTDDVLINKLFSQGFMIAEDQAMANFLNDRLTAAKKTMDVVGVRGFDRKYYIVTRQKLAELQPRMLVLLKKEKTLAELAVEFKSEDLSKAILEVIKENGDVIEKRKGVFVGV